MRPRILFVGGSNGSWAIRGLQIARALMGARSTSRPTADDWGWAEIIVLVKRAMYQWGEDAARTGKPLVWDVLDHWQQPEQNDADLRRMAQDAVSASRDALIIGATKAMADALGGVYIPHHSRPGLTPQPIRARVKVVAYEGTTKYLGSWKAVCEQACAARGWSFVVNPKSLAEADIVVALRGEQWDGELCREWKSGVKLVNAMAAGRPIITQDSAAYRELCPEGNAIESPDDLNRWLDYWSQMEARARAADVCRGQAMAYTLDSVAHQYRDVFRSLLQEAA